MTDETTLVNIVTTTEEDVTMIGRSTQFGNPFRLSKDGGNYTRLASVKEYKNWFYENLKSDPEFREAVHALEGETLGCFCAPKPCHGDVIVEYLNSNDWHLKQY